MNFKSSKCLVVPLVILICVAALSAPSAAMAQPTSHVMQASKRAAFQDAMRKLWVDHIVWTRVFIISAVADLPDKAAATDRLLKNQSDIGEAIKPYYSNAAGNKLTTLLREHITTAAEVVTAAKGGDKVKQDDATKRWFANADQIAAFLSEANPKSWPRAEMQKMMRDHLNLTTDEAVARLQSNWAADIAAYDKVNEQILHMADMLSAGIISQHAEKFK